VDLTAAALPFAMQEVSRVRNAASIVGGLVLVWSVLASGITASAGGVRVHHLEGLVHGFLALRDQADHIIARGELVQTSTGPRVTSRLSFYFRDGSRYDETAVFSQKAAFRLIQDRLQERGPSFPRTLDMTIDMSKGHIHVDYSDDGKQKAADKQIDLPPDLANGLIPVLLKNVDRDRPPQSLPFIVATPEPQLIHLEIEAARPERFSKDDDRRLVTEYVLKPDIGGVKGFLAPLVGKQPPDARVWVLGGDAPAFLAADQQFFPDGPLWRIELSVPVWGEQ
jgi:hypothetical protein